jgi:hypothetical protein
MYRYENVGKNEYNKNVIYYLESLKIQVFIIFSSCAACVFYILNTYSIPNSDIFYKIIGVVFFLVFLIDYCISILAHKPYQLGIRLI